MLPRVCVSLIMLVAVLTVPVSPAAAAGGALTPLTGDHGCFGGAGARPTPPCAAIARGQFDASSMAVSPDGKFAYAISTYSGRAVRSDGTVYEIPGGTIAAFSRNTATGALTQLAGTAACIKDREAPANGVTTPCTVKAIGLAGAKTIAMSRDGKHIYVASLNNWAIAAFSRNAVTGALTQLPGADACVQDATFNEAECPRKATGLAGVRWVTVSPDGKSVYASAPAADGIVGFSRNPTTGALTPRQCIKDKRARVNACTATGVGLNYPRSITVSPDNKSVYVASDSADAGWYGDQGNGDAVSVFRRDLTTGRLTQLPGADACIMDRLARATAGCTTIGRGLLDAVHVTVSPDGKHVYVGSHASRAGAIAVFARNAFTGALTQPAGRAGCLGNSYDCTPARGIGGVDAITISPDGANAYATGFYSLSLALFRRDATTGLLTQLTTQACIEDTVASSRADCPMARKGVNGPRTVTLSPDGSSAYLPSSTGGTIATFAR